MASVGRVRDMICIWDQLHTTLSYIYWDGGETLRFKEAEEWGLSVLCAIVAHVWRGAHLPWLRL